MSKWSETTRRDFDTAAPDVQLGLFAADSQGYTGADLFTEQEEAAAADADEIRAGDYVTVGLEAPARVTEVGDGWVEIKREAGASYRIETMHVRKITGRCAEHGGRDAVACDHV